MHDRCSRREGRFGELGSQLRQLVGYLLLDYNDRHHICEHLLGTARDDVYLVYQALSS